MIDFVSKLVGAMIGSIVTAYLACKVIDCYGGIPVQIVVKEDKNYGL